MDYDLGLAVARRVEQSIGPRPTVQLLRSAFDAEFKAPGLDAMAKQVVALDVAAFSYYVSHREDKRNPEALRPMFEGSRGTSPPYVKDLSEEQIEYWRRRLEDSSISVSKARLADLLWHRTKEFRYARTAVLEYLAAIPVNSEDDILAVSETVDCLNRAGALSMAMNIERDRTRRAITEFALHLLSKGGGHISILIGSNVDLIVQDAVQARPLIEKLLEMAGQAALQGGQARHLERVCLQLAEELEKGLGRADAAVQIGRRIPASFEREAEERNNEGGIVKMVLLNDALRQYSDRGLSNDVQRVKGALHMSGEEAVTELKSVEVRVEVPKDRIVAVVDEIAAQGKTLAPHAHLYYLPSIAELWPEWSVIERRVEDMQRKAPLQFLVSQTVLGPDGRPLPRPTEPVATKLFDEIRRYSQDVGLATFFTSLVIDELRKREAWSVDLVVAALASSALFTGAILKAVRPGITALEKGRYWEALHVLVPNIERVVRAAGQAVGAQSYSYTPGTGELRWKSLDQLLEDEAVQKVLAHLGKDAAREMACILVDSRGLNLRNDVAHGIVDPDGDHRSGALLCLLILISLATLSVGTTT